MKKQLPTYTLFISLTGAALFLPSIVSWCCGTTLAADESRFALFRNGLVGQTGLAPFY